MEDSAFEALMISVYIVIFVVATSLTIFLFNSTVEFADKAFEYGKISTGDSIIETSSAPKFNVITGAELLTYYYNYTDPDKYGEGVAVESKYIFQNTDGTPLRDIDIKQSYTLVYKRADTGQKPIIEVKKVASEQEEDTSPPIVVDKKPTDPVITTHPFIPEGENVVPKTQVEFAAESSVTHSFLTNNIKQYNWKIDYSPEDGRADYTFVTPGTIGELTILKTASKALEFRSGRNVISVTALDVLGNYSNTVSKIIDVGYKNPIINSIREINNKVTNSGRVDVDSPSGASLNFIADAISQNNGGYVQKYDWYVNNTLVQSTASQKLSRTFVPGNYMLKVIVHDSIQGTSQREFEFTVNTIPAPTITSNNATINANKLIAITTPTINVSFTSTLPLKYSISKYIWTVDGVRTEMSANSPINNNYSIGNHTVTAYGVTAGNIVSQVSTFTFTVKEDFVPYVKEFYSNNSYETVTLQPGKYIFETWGAKGGNGEDGGGYGGYSKGQITLSKATNFYVYVGTNDGYNGGGRSLLKYSIGGGATDIRLTPGAWDNTVSLRSRIIVAGGGGGRGGANILKDAGGPAGGLLGLNGMDNFGTPGEGGKQTSGGRAGEISSYGATNGVFGKGGNGDNSTNTSAGAGGGGYYGGGGGSSDLIKYNDLDDSGGGGGSSFISGYPGCNAINSYGNHTNQPVHFSGLSFTNMTMTGAANAGTGKAKIEKIR